MEQAVQDHDDNLTAVLERARQRGLKLNKQKLKLRRTEVAYMSRGFKISRRPAEFRRLLYVLPPATSRLEQAKQLKTRYVPPFNLGD